MFTRLKAEMLIESKLAVIGLGYVGLPLAVEFGKYVPVLGYDVNNIRVTQLKDGFDVTREVDVIDLSQSVNLKFSSTQEDLSAANIYIVTVPTPIDEHKRPDLMPLKSASAAIGKVLSEGDIVIYESTVYPGCTEDECVPILEEFSGLVYNSEFFIGYSPERINPGDKEHRITSIKKVTSGSTPDASEFIDSLYQLIIEAGTYRAPSIKVAEAAKVIENTQRDVNIALINELSMLFSQLGIDTHSVLEAAATKWNFLPFKPGLVGGHCIGVDPYYLTHKAQSINYHPEIILSGRRVNDGMGKHVAHKLIKRMIKNRLCVNGAKILIMGVTFKENCPDTRNSRVLDVIEELKDHDCDVSVFDPWVDSRVIEEEFLSRCVIDLEENCYDAIILAVSHEEFINLGYISIERLLKTKGVLFDLKSIFPNKKSILRL